MEYEKGEVTMKYQRIHIHKYNKYTFDVELDEILLDTVSFI